MKDRLDKKLVELGLASTRSQALQYIQAGVVFENNVQITKPSHKTIGEHLEVRTQTHYVGRGAQKLIDALASFPIKVLDKICADIGASTGGFTQVLLEHQAKRVYAIDVGHDQLDERLVNDGRVVNMPGTNIRAVESLPEKIELMVADLSFISLEIVLPHMQKLLTTDAELVVLVKPQFEVGREGLDKNGLADVSKHLDVLVKIKNVCEQLKLGLVGAKKCALVGKTGNQEFLYWLKNSAHSSVSEKNLQELTL